MGRPVARAVFKRDLTSWFGNPTGYVFITLFVFLSAFALVGPAGFFQNNLANLDTLNEWYRVLLLFFVPAVTMSIWAGERSWGTHELLFTLPARDYQIVLGKFAAAAGVFTIALLFTFPLPLGLWLLGNPDLGLIACNYLGFWLLGLLLISVAMVGSQLTENLTVSFILGALLCALVVFSEDILAGLFPSLGAVMVSYGPNALFMEIARGIVSPPAILLFVGMAVAFLYLNLVLLARRHWQGGRVWAHTAVRFAALLVVAGAAAVVGMNRVTRVDATTEKIHSLSGETRNLLADLDPQRPVFIQAFVSDDVPREFVQTRRTLLNLLRQYSALGGGAIQLRVVPTERYSDAAREAESNFAIRPRPWASEEGARMRTFDVFMGVAFQSGIEEVVVPFVDRKIPVEYELTRSIRVVASADRRKVGVMKTDADVFGGFDFQTMRSKPEWEIVRELKLQYEVDSVDPAADYPDDLDVLMVPMVSSLTQEQMDRLAEYIRGGGPALLIDDPFPASAPGTSASDPKGGQQQNPMMMGRQPPSEPKGDVRALLAEFNLRYSPDTIVWDQFNPHPIFEASPAEIVFVASGSGARPVFNPESPISAGLQEVVVVFGGEVGSAELESKLTFTPLLRTGALSGTVAKSDAFQWSPFGGQSLNPRRSSRYVMGSTGQVLAAQVRGKPSDEASAEVHVTLLTDLDMLGPQFFAMRREGVGDTKIEFDNVTFILNCVDALAGDIRFIELRKRRPIHRTLTGIEREQEDYNRKWLQDKRKAEERAQKELDAAQKRLDDRVAEVSNNPELDQRSKDIQIETIRDVEQRKLDIAKAKIEDARDRAIDAAQAAKLNNQYGIQRQYTALTLAGSPLPAILVAMLVLLGRRRRERIIVPNQRQVGGAA